jgi:DNA-binding MarR family transcriptional regulator
MRHMPDLYDPLKLDNQLCFPLYACSKEIINRYRPFLDDLDLTYTQYIAMMVLWEAGEISCKDLCRRLYLDTGTISPLLKKLESKGYIKRCRSEDDERNLVISITEEGMSLRDRAVDVPKNMACCVDLTKEEAATLYTLLYKVLSGLTEQN